MHLARLQTNGFRCLDNFEMEFGPGLNVIVGPNNAGKTAILEAVSLVLSVIHNPQREIYVNQEDFWHSPDGQEEERDEFRITLELDGIPQGSIGYFANWLVPGKPNVARITVICQRDQSDPDEVFPRWNTGDGGNHTPNAETMRRIRPIFLPPLRDAETHLRPGRRSRLARLVQQISEDASEQAIESKFKTVQDDIIGEPPFSIAAKRVNERLTHTSGAYYGQIAQLGFVEPDFRRITEMLQVRIGLHGSADFGLSENGLGYNNLLYIATILSQLSNDTKQDMRLLLVEEPEAHLHPQMQQVLVDALMDASKEQQPTGEERTQIIMTSHSPGLAAHVPIGNLAVLHKHRKEPTRLATDTSRLRKGKPLVRSIQGFQLAQKTTRDLTRYLDSTKSNLFFAEGVILVEGLAEMLLFPILAKAMNLNLNEHHISLVNVDGLAFDPFWSLFSDLGRLQIPCALVTDSDPHFQKTDKWYRPRGHTATVPYDDKSLDEVDGDEVLYPRTLITYGRAYELEKKVLAQPSGSRVFRNFKTLEFDMALTPYLLHMVAVCKTMDTDIGDEMETATGRANTDREKAISFFKRFPDKQKATFAQNLADYLEPLVNNHWDVQHGLHGADRTLWQPFLPVPAYIGSAVQWVTGGCDWDVL